MQSTFAGIEIGKRSLTAQNQGMVTIGHNLANASTEGYSRQRVELGTMEPLYAPDLTREDTPGQIGQGVVVTRIDRVKDNLLEGRIVGESSLEGYWNTRDKYVLMLEQIHNEPSDSSVRTLMDKFWDSWQELSLRPADTAAREAVLSRGNALTEGIRDQYRRLSDFRETVDGDVRGTVDQVNDFTRQIAELDNEIEKSKAMGDNPNDLLDRRDLLVEKLGHLVPVSVDNRDKDEFMVHVDGIILVQGKIARPLEMRGADQDGFASPVWKDTGQPFVAKAGQLGALLELRDGDARNEMQTLDTMTLTFSDLVNETHRAAYGLNGKTGLDFFKEWPFINNVAGNYDRNGDGVYDSTYLYRMTGSNQLQAQEQIGLAGTIRLSSATGQVDVPYNPTDTVADLVNRINHAGAEVTARLTREGKLELRATPAGDRQNPDFVIRHIEDTGQFLVGYAGILKAAGPAGAYDWGVANATVALQGPGVDYAVAPLAHPAGWIAVAPEISSDIGSIAAGFGDNGRPAASGDGSAALAIAALRTQPVMVGTERTFDDHFAEAVASIGLAGEQAQRAMDTHDRIGKQLRDLRQSISGVNMDEELANMIKFQHGYEAAAKFVSHIDSMLDIIINRM
ncbi:MAG TPA: flagellar hook-associated protein FlgK, partial [Rectinemataceae bacterium]|nr:flagellar hook-associated protein FlgK [Rectinemataceae bacterium]